MADLFKGTEKMMGMSDAVWRRHANPWSVATRFTIAPLLTLAVWSRVWIGWWALLPVAAVIAWSWLNPRAFPPPKSTNNWASLGVMGERLWLARKEQPIAAHHVRVCRVLTALSGLGALVWLWGVIVLDLTATLSGMIATMSFKAWFVDRMVWLMYDERARRRAKRNSPDA